MSIEADIAYLTHGQPLAQPGGGLTDLARRLISSFNLLLDRHGGVRYEFLPLRSRTVAQLQALTPAGPALGYCSNETGGETLVYYAPTAGVWRRTRDDVTIS